MPKYREHDDGTRVYPIRGSPPIPPPGFEAAAGQPFILIPLLPECVNRTIGHVRMPCGKLVEVKSCSKGYRVSRKECLACIESGRRDS